MNGSFQAKVKRWSIPVAPEDLRAKNIHTLLPAEHISYNWEAFDQVTDFALEIASFVRFLHKMDFSREACKDFHEIFQEPPGDYFGDDWEGATYEEIYRILSLLTEKGYDVRKMWQAYRSALYMIWEGLPDFYKAEQIAGEKPPELPQDYDQKKPFPKFEIPNDIDHELIK